MAEDFVAAARWLKLRPDCTGKWARSAFVLAAGWPIPWRFEWDQIGGGCPVLRRRPDPDDVPKIKAAILVDHGGSTRLGVDWPAYERS